jgi:hypothetical protein
VAQWMGEMLAPSEPTEGIGKSGEIEQGIGGPLQGRFASGEYKLEKITKQVPSKQSTRPQGVTPQNTVTSIITVTRSPNLTGRIVALVLH